MSKFLIWGISLGARTNSLVPLWLRSLKEVGNWRHDIVLLGNVQTKRQFHRDLIAIDIVDDVARRHQLPYAKWDDWTTHNLKSEILHQVDIRSYDYVLYLDVDILANSPRLEDLVDAKCRRGMIALQEDCEPLGPKRLNALELLGAPTEIERKQWALRPICAGIMGFPTTPVGRQALQEYHEACAAMRFRRSDQAKITALLNRHYEGKWELMGDTVHGRRSTPRYEETLVHFTGQRDDTMRQYYQESLGLTSHHVTTRRKSMCQFISDILGIDRSK
jgi:hypothetical protein